MNGHRRPSATPGPGFLGSTSSSADYIGAQWQHDLHDVAEGDDIASDGNAELFPTYPQRQIDAGAALLDHFLVFTFLETFIQNNRQNSCGVSLVSPWITYICNSIRADLYRPLLQSWELSGDQSPQHSRILEHLSRRLFRNTSSALEYDGRCSLEHYASLFTGQNLRWEAVGMFFTAVGLGATNVRIYAPSQSSSGMNSRQRAVLARRMLEGGQMCLSFCEKTGHMVDPEIWLSFSLSHLASVVEGDSSHKTWRQLGDAISTCFAMGLHSEKGVSEQVPFWLSELRKRTFAQLYNIDKTVSSLLGRPPRLCRRYCAMQLPLDLDDSCLSLPRDQLEAKVNLLDTGGWHREFSPHGSAITRALLICDMVRDDILELSLTTLPQDDNAIAQDIWRRSRSAWQSLPPWLRVISGSASKVERDVISHVFLDFQYNDFLLERLMVRRFHRPSMELCRIARELLQLNLRMIPDKEDVGGDTQNISWLITQYGLPAAGVLALELLEHSQAGLRSPEHLPRSEVIQNLSRLIAYIKPLVPKEDANYVLCDQARKVIQRILDQILEPKPSDESETADVAEESWLPASQSEPDFWTSLPEHPLLASLGC